MELSNYNGTTQFIRYFRKQKLNERIEIAKMEQQQATYENYTLNKRLRNYESKGKRI